MFLRMLPVSDLPGCHHLDFDCPDLRDTHVVLLNGGPRGTAKEKRRTANYYNIYTQRCKFLREFLRVKMSLKMLLNISSKIS